MTKSKRAHKPLVSVVIPVYNAGKYLEFCLDSILNQTYKNIEVIAVDDHSSDNSFQILKEYASKNKRLKVFKNKENSGVSVTAKKAIAHASGDYIARMDADDIALPTRIEKQIKHLEKHPKTVAVGGQCIIINSENRVIGKKTFPTSFKDIYKYIFTFAPVQQPTLMIARHRLPKNFVYYIDGMNTAEELELFFKLFQYGKVENISDVVLFYRFHNGNTSMQNIRQTFLLTLIARIKAVFRYDYNPTFLGVLITFAQAAIILSLPKKASITLYKIFRDSSMTEVSVNNSLLPNISA